ncbi:MAG: hypothetical protein CNLJKLNK_00006 [Holosporales bacterium]
MEEMMIKNLLKSMGSRLDKRKMNVLSLLCGKGTSTITGYAAANKTRQDIWAPTRRMRWLVRQVGLSLILLGFLGKDGVYAKLMKPTIRGDGLSWCSLTTVDGLYPHQQYSETYNKTLHALGAAAANLVKRFNDSEGLCTYVTWRKKNNLEDSGAGAFHDGVVGGLPVAIELSRVEKQDSSAESEKGYYREFDVGYSTVGLFLYDNGLSRWATKADACERIRLASSVALPGTSYTSASDVQVGGGMGLDENGYAKSSVQTSGQIKFNNELSGWIDQDFVSIPDDLVVLGRGAVIYGGTVKNNITYGMLKDNWWNSPAWQSMRFNSEDPDFQKLPDEIKAWFVDASQPTLSVVDMPTLWQAGTDYIGHITADEPSLTYSAVNVPMGMRVGADGAVTGRTPKVGTYALSVKGVSSDGSEDAASMNLTIVPKVWADGVTVTTEGKVLTYKKAGQTVARVNADGHITAETLPFSGQLLAQPLVGDTYTYRHTSGWSVVSNRTGDEPNVTVNATFTRNSRDGASLDATASSIMKTAGYFDENVNLQTDLPFATTVTDAALKDVRIKNIYLTTSGHTTLDNATIDTSVWRVNGQTAFANLNVDGGVVWNMTKAEVKGKDVGYGALNKATNAYVANPKSALTAQTFTLNNENILIIAYDPNDADDLAVGSQNIISTTGEMPRKFDYVYKALVDGDLLALESLTPVEDGSAGINSRISMRVTQSDHNVTLTLTQQKQHVPSTALLDITFWERVFKENPQLASLFFSSDTTVTQSTLQTAQQANSLLAVIANVRSMLPNMVNTQNTQFHQTVARSMHSSASTSGKLHNLCNALAKEGPVAFDSEQGRVWISPYVNVNTDDGSHGSGYGALMGGEYRNLDARYILAGYVGAGADKKDETVDHVHSTHITAGTYAAYNPWMDGRFDALYMVSRNSVHNAMTDTHNQKGTYRNVVQTVDVMFSQVFRLDDTHTWSVRPSLGHTYIKSTTGGYTLKGDLINNKQKTSRMSATKSISQEVYGGLGLRFDTKFDDVRMRITGVYEYGYEYRHAGKTPDITTSLYISKLTPGAANKKSRTHYISANASFLAKDDWKFIVSYNGAYSGSSKNHMVAAKFERRF